MKRSLVIAAATIAVIISQQPAQARHHHYRHHRHHAVDANGNRSLVALINYKLRRYVHPTGKCGGDSEQLATYYWEDKWTAQGKRFNPHGMTAASRHLPFGTKLHITNPHNGKSVHVVINDRGPYTDAKLDLALGAAKALGLNQSSYVCVANL